MKRFVSEVVRMITESAPGASQSEIVRVDHMPDPHIYWGICNQLDNHGLEFRAYLSWEKMQDFAADRRHTRVLEQMHDRDWVDHDGKMTHWRNSSSVESGLVVLMGTEAVEDRGGLADFFSITPLSVEGALSGDYTSWINHAITDYGEGWADEVNKVISAIFEQVPTNIMRFSSIFDRISEAGRLSAKELVVALCDNLHHDWGLPRIRGDHSTPVRIRLIRDAGQFRARLGYTDGMTQGKRHKLHKKFEKFVHSNPEIVADDPAAQYQDVFDSFDDLQTSIIEYLAGVDIQANRDQLFRCDFSLISEILAVRVRPTSPKRKKSNRRYGEPLEAFLRIMLEVITEEASVGNPVDELVFRMNSASLADCTTDRELFDSWKNICIWTGGILDFIAGESWEFASKPIHIAWEGSADPFHPASCQQMIEDGFVNSAAASRKLSRVDIEVFTGSGRPPHEYTWLFEPLNAWVQAFTLLKKDDATSSITESSRGFLPVGQHPKVAEYTRLINEDDFLTALDSLAVEFIDLTQVVGTRVPDDSQILAHMGSLGMASADFVDDINKNGFFSSIAGSGTSGVAFVGRYTAVIKAVTSGLSKSDYSIVERDQLHALSNAFTIVPEGEGFDGGAVSAAMVPPFHPAMLEKITAKAQFIRQGALEILAALSRGSENLDARYARLLQLSTITSSVDVIIGKQSRVLPVRNTFAYYSLYRDSEETEFLLSSLGTHGRDVTADDQVPLAELQKRTPISRMIARQIQHYCETYPFRADTLRVLFVNPPDLQPVVSGIHEAVEELRNRFSPIRLRMQVMLPESLHGGRAYLRYWLESFFGEADDVQIETFCSNLELPATNSIDALEPKWDLAYLQDILDAEEAKFDLLQRRSKFSPAETRFPMVYPVLTVGQGTGVSKISASQPQFEAAHSHTQLANLLIHEFSKEGSYHLVRHLRLSETWRQYLELFHASARWVVCIDKGIDKRFLEAKGHRVISFSTGEGPFGEYNYTVSSADANLPDIKGRLTRLLRPRFSGLSDSELEEISSSCLRECEKLDGVKILRALNPNDYSMHSFLAHILTARLLGARDQTSHSNGFRTLVSLDAYTHWFDRSAGDGSYPDFLMCEVVGGSRLEINASLIECKMGSESYSKVHKARQQVESGHAVLSQHWNPDSDTVERRYWYAQLYRALAFSLIQISDGSQEQEQISTMLLDLLAGDFSIHWSGLVLGFWLDSFAETESYEHLDSSSKLPIEYRSYGIPQIKAMLHRTESPQGSTENGDEATSTDLDDSNPDRIVPPSERVNQVKREPSPADKRSAVEDDCQRLDREPNEPVDRSEDGIRSSPIAHDAEALSPGQSKKVDEAGSLKPQTESSVDLTIRSEPIRVFIGRDIKSEKEVYWEYGHPSLPNRHILISGRSGTGKTYLMQAMMMELVDNGVSSVVFDYTDGFTESKLEPEFREHLKDRIIEFPVYHMPFPMNPFKRHEIEVAGKTLPQKEVDVAERIKSVFQVVYGFGDQQASSIYRATRNGMEQHGERMSLRLLNDELHTLAGQIPNAKTVLSKIEPLVDRDPFGTAGEHDWSEIADGIGTVFIIQLSGFTRDVQLLLTELILWDAWYYNVKHGTKDRPFPVILDEAQNLDHRSGSPSTMVLTEGRKFGWSGWFATQFLKAQLKAEEMQRLQQASQKIYFNPPEAEISQVATMIEADNAKRGLWHPLLSGLRKGECVVVGYEAKSGGLDRMSPRIVRVASISERLKRRG